MNDPAAAPLAVVDPLGLAPIGAPLLPVDPEAVGEPALPADYPAWQRDVVSLSSRARAVLATIVPTIVRTLAFWDHRLREIALGPRTLGVDAAGCYRLR